MLYKFSFIILLIFSFATAKAQITKNANQAQTKTLCDSCGDCLVFTKAETSPGFENGEIGFQDSLSNYLNTKNIEIKKGQLIFKLTICKHGDVINVEKSDGGLTDEATLIEWIMNSKGLFFPATQNKHLVCCYLWIRIEFSKNKITTSIVNP